VSSDKYLLAAGTDDAIKIYANDSLVSHHIVGNGVDNILFNNVAANILLASSDTSLLVYNVETQSVYKSFDAGSGIQSLDWDSQGSNVLSVSKDNIIRLWDVRSPTCISQGNCHSGVKPSKVACLKNNTAVTTGFSLRREREFCLWDLRDLTKPISTNKIDTSIGILTPLYDRDTDLVFMMGKGDSVIRWAQIEDLKVQEFPAATVGNNILGSCLIPKKACSIMSGEIDRIMVITGDGSNMIPVSVVVPRKSYSDFHPDIFPDTLSDISNTSAAQWEQDVLTAPDLISLDPKKSVLPTKDVENMKIKEEEVKPSLSNTGSHEMLNKDPMPKPASKIVSLPKSSTYRFIEGKLDVLFKDINNLNSNNSNECNGFEANTDVMAFALNGAGGRVGIWFTKDVGRVPVKIPSVICGICISINFRI
jgi:coronin-7